MYMQIVLGAAVFLFAVLLGAVAAFFFRSMRIRRIILALDRGEMSAAYFERKELAALQYELAVMKGRRSVLVIEVRKESGLIELYAEK